MGIRFVCEHCGGAMNVKEHLAGKRGICKHCHGKVDIPRQSTIDKPAKHRATTLPPAGPNSGPTAAAAAIATRLPQASASTLPDPVAEAPWLNWYVLPPGATDQYGPAGGELFRAWIAEGRVSADSLVWRQDWAQWQRAAEVLPQLAATPLATPIGPGIDLRPNPAAAVPANSLKPGVAVDHKVHNWKRDKAQRNRTIVISLMLLVFALLPLMFFVLKRL
ncbi:MAG TPA: DUF4339 domain-containing protein [Pirellulales bacterium]|nr:DUF4339 domain-containing protein [Pirellulales bacterium]